MIIVGTYPDGFDWGKDFPKLQSLNQTLSLLLPKKLYLHILPFYPNSGDFGFAPDDWFQVRNDLGGWEDLSNIASHWNVIVDGIYNHVGVNHKWVKGFLDSPENYKDIIHAYKTKSPEDGPISPRGQPVLTASTPGYYLWKTFSDAAVDIRLESHVVQDEIDSHLKFLSSLGIWGVRLDAVAYYAKALGMQVRHNPGVYTLANNMADRVRSHGLQVLAQLDCDEDGLHYYNDSKRRNIPINDFTYSTSLALSVLEEDPSIVINHVLKTQKAERILIRVPRTHDGILLRSKLLSQNDKNKIIGFAKSKNIIVRISSGNPYELTCSAPYLYSLLASEVNVSKTILFTIAITGMMSGWSYFYLPYIMGYIPEHYMNPGDFNDPRAINRAPINNSALQDYLISPDKDKIVSLLDLLNTIHLSQGENFKSNFMIDDELLLLSTLDEKYRVVANFSSTKDKNIASNWLKGEVLAYNDFSLNNNVLGRLGYVIMSLA